MTPLPTLYARNKDGSVQVWSIEVDGHRFRSTSGRQGGAMTTPLWTECETKNPGKKNEVSPEDQAEKEALSRWKDQIKTGGYREDITQIDNLDFNEPMRAKEYTKRKHKINFEIDVQYKLDGFRANPQPDTNIILSRYNNPIVAVPHLNDLLAQFHAKTGLKLDGELYSHEHKDDFNTLCSILKKQNPTTAEIDRAKVMEFWCFDLIDLTLPWKERFSRLKEIWKEWHPVFGKKVRLVWTTRVHSEAEWDALHQKATRLGFEGTMGRDPEALYEFSRTDALLKRKDFQDAEFEIKDFLPGRGNKSVMAAKVVCWRDAAQVVDFEAGITGDWTFCEELLTNKQNYIGKQATIKFINYTPPKPDGSGSVPRHGTMIKIDKF